MAAMFTGGKTPKQQSTEQALRRLKYLHTSLMPHEGKTIQSGQKLDPLLCKKGLRRPEYEERVTVPRRTPEKRQCFFSLQPKTVRKHKTDKRNSRVAKYKQKKKNVCTGRAPLQTTMYGTPISPRVEKEQFELKSSNTVTSGSPVGRARSSKSAPGTLCTVDPYKCAECFANDFEHAHKKQATKKYCTNIRINRITFSARPTGSNSKSMRKTTRIEVPKNCFFNGWGVRSLKEPTTRGNLINNDSKNHSMDAIDVTAGLRTLKLETRNDRMRQGYTEEIIPQPPPTPVRQIDIKLPQGVVVKYHLSEDE